MIVPRATVGPTLYLRYLEYDDWPTMRIILNDWDDFGCDEEMAKDYVLGWTNHDQNASNQFPMTSNEPRVEAAVACLHNGTIVGFYTGAITDLVSTDPMLMMHPDHRSEGLSQEFEVLLLKVGFWKSGLTLVRSRVRETRPGQSWKNLYSPARKIRTDVSSDYNATELEVFEIDAAAFEAYIDFLGVRDHRFDFDVDFDNGA